MGFDTYNENPDENHMCFRAETQVIKIMCLHLFFSLDIKKDQYLLPTKVSCCVEPGKERNSNAGDERISSSSGAQLHLLGA